MDCIKGGRVQVCVLALGVAYDSVPAGRFVWAVLTYEPKSACVMGLTCVALKICQFSKSDLANTTRVFSYGG